MYNFLILFTFITLTYANILADNSERAELVFHNRTMLKDMVLKYGKFNRTYSALNVSFTLLRDFPGGKLMASISGDQFFHNEFRYTGQQFTLNACQVWKTNMFHIPEQFRKAGFVIDACNMKKGAYHINNFIMNKEYYPKYIPKGQWRINVKAFYEGAGEVFFLRWYFEMKKED